MEFTLIVILSISVWFCGAVVRENKPWGTSFSDEYCDYDVFRAQCSSGQTIMMQSGVYGHMKVGKCIKADLGHLGCKENVIQLLDERCSGTQQCELPVHHESLRSFQPCTAGLGVYLDATYTCINGISSQTLCKHLSAMPKQSYVSSTQIHNAQCLKQSGLRIRSEKGQMIHLTIINLSISEDGSGPVDIGFIIDGESSDTMPIVLTGREESEIGTSTSSSITVMMNEAYTGMKYLISYKAVGCPDIQSPAGTIFEREGDVANVVCSYTQVAWQLNCRNGRWLGVIGNCSMPAPSTTTQMPVKTTEQLALQKDVVYLIIICSTIFLSVLVITVGYVCLKRARILQEQQQKSNEWDQGTTKMILLPKPRPSSDYLTPRFNPDGQSQQTPIYDTPLPDPPLVNTGTRPTLKRNNEEEFNNTMSSNSTDYTRKYFVLDQDYMNTKNLLDA